MIACVVWYKQRPEYLERLLVSLVGRVDGAVFLDGPYEGLAEDERSSDEEYAMIMRFADLLPLRVVEGMVYASEPAKRTAAARMVEASFPTATHVLVIDSDEALLEYPVGDYAGLFQEGHLVARMRRVYPLTPTLRWGPTHATVTDDTRTYWDMGGDHTMAENSASPAWGFDFKVYHTPASKLIQREYDAYNATTRPLVEAR